MNQGNGPRISLTDLKIDPYAPAEMADRAQAVGVAKARLDLINTLTLAVLAGAFIALGAQLATIAGIDSTLGYGPTRMLVGLVFSLGLILVVIAGAELFTGNTLIIMAWLGGKVTTRQLVRNWSLAYVGNFAGALGTVALVFYAGQWALAGNQVGATAVSVASAKVELSFTEAVTRGILCNAMVNLSVWLCLSARSNVDKIFAIIPPIGGFVASGFEHSIANMYFIPIGILLKDKPAVVAAGGLTPAASDHLTWGSFLWDNLLPVTLGNIIGGGVMVAAVYWLVYLRQAQRITAASHSAEASQPGTRTPTG
jgi:formate/nitrite transporter